MKPEDVLDNCDAYDAGRLHYAPDMSDLREALEQAVRALKDIAGGFASPTNPLPAIEQPPAEFRHAMWTWSQARAREGLGR